MKKENNILELFFNFSSKSWQFEEIVKASKVSRDKVNKWLIRLEKEKIIKKIKEKGKRPYYKADFYSPNYDTRKRLFALEMFYKSGFLASLLTLKEADTIIIFGSFSRSDWHWKSDIDLFIKGKADDFNKYLFERKLKRNIQVFFYEEVYRAEGLMKNILCGYRVKGQFAGESLEFSEQVL